MKSLRIFCVAVIIVGMYSCTAFDRDGFSTHESGLKYKFVEEYPGMPQAQVGDVLDIEMTYKNQDGEVLFTSRDRGRAYLRKLEEPSHKGGSFEDALAMLRVGDSAIFKINAANFYSFSEGFENVPQNIRVSDYFTFYIKLNEIIRHDSFESHLLDKYHESEEVEMKILQDFLKRANINIEPSSTGYYYVEEKKGQGNLIETGNLVSIYYTGKLVDGRVFDTNYGKSPMNFRVGFGQVIPGMDQGIRNMREGGKGKLIIPSKLAYGVQGVPGKIMPYSSLIFEIEVVKVH